jgi:hypothetical protein
VTVASPLFIAAQYDVVHGWPEHHLACQREIRRSKDEVFRYQKVLLKHLSIYRSEMRMTKDLICAYGYRRLSGSIRPCAVTIASITSDAV